MSGFDKDSLIKAQRARRRRMMLGIGGVILILLISAGVYLGTAVIDRVSIAVAPDEARDIAQLEILEGTGWIWNDEIIAVRSPLKLQVSADGFKREVLTVGDATWRRGQLDVVLKPLPATVKATTKPESDEVRWYLNGALVSVASQLTIDLPAGQLTIEARHLQFEPTSQSITLERGESYQLSLDLKPVKGQVEITSAPSGAEVSLNSEAIGKTPLHLELEGGEYEIALSLTNHDPRKDSFVISLDNAEVSRHYKLAVSNRDVTFSLTPSDGSLTVGGNKVASRETASVSLPVNSRQTATYSKPGFRTQDIEFEVNSNFGNQIELELQPVYGMVEVRSSPTADVSHNGKVIGKTPVLVRMQTLPQTFTVSQTRFLPETHTITPVEGTTRVLEVNLVSEKEHRLKSSPDTYVNSLGMKFKLFKEADYFTMGSKPGELNSRPNEFYRQVQLQRPFYAGVHEVTAEAFHKFIGANRMPTVGNRPITGVSWKEAAKFSNWLSKLEGLRPVYRFTGDEYLGSDSTADGYRMLTEAEWEWLARKAGRNQQTIFPWGDETIIPQNSGNLADVTAKGYAAVVIPQYNDGQAVVSATGLFQPNPVGIHDLTGNVSEWTHDAYDHTVPSGDQIELDPFDTSNATYHTIKGSSWASGEVSELRVAYRTGGSLGNDRIGFRLARYLY